MKKEDIVFLNQLVESLEENIHTLEEAYLRKDFKTFNKSKKFILQIQKKISEVIG